MLCRNVEQHPVVTMLQLDPRFSWRLRSFHVSYNTVGTGDGGVGVSRSL